MMNERYTRGCDLFLWTPHIKGSRSLTPGDNMILTILKISIEFLRWLSDYYRTEKWHSPPIRLPQELVDEIISYIYDVITLR